MPTKSLERLKNLKKLSLSQNRIKSFEYLRLSNLISLNLAFNSIKSIDNKPLLDTKINQINLQNNELQFQDLLIILSEALTLEELNLDYNKLFKIDVKTKSIISSSSLKLLSLQGNQLGQESLDLLSKFKFEKLEKLNLAKNKIDVFLIDESMPVLKDLILDKNPLKQYSFGNLENSLQELSLSNTGLEEIDLSQMKALQKLKLNGNKLKKLNIGQINSIDLQNNGLSEIPESICSSESIRELDLRLNNIKTIHSRCLKSSLKGINLNSNPLKCSCENKDLREWIDVNIQRDLIEFIKWECEEPILMRHRLFTNFNTQQCYPQKHTETTTVTKQIQTLKFNQQISEKKIEKSIDFNNTSIYYVTIAFILGCTILSISLIIIIYSLSVKNLKVKHAISKLTMIQGENSSGIFSDRTLSTQSSVTRHYYHDFNSWYSQLDLTETKQQQKKQEKNQKQPFFISHLYDEIIANNLLFNPIVNTQEIMTPQAIAININQGSLFV
jgi:Leucine-rich repeat (LRR) protein